MTVPNHRALQQNPETSIYPLDIYHRIVLESGLFDREWYVNKYPDLSVPATDAPLTHYLTIGAWEDRCPNKLFDSGWYLKTNVDVAALKINPLIHYILYGASEGRYPNPLFDSGWYLKQNPDVAASRMNPLTHYLKWGAAEGRDPHRLFSTRQYIAKYLIGESAGVNPLFHYLSEGYAQGLIPGDLDALYDRSLLRQEQRYAIEISEVMQHISVMIVKPHFVILIDESCGGDFERTLLSTERQIYDNCSVTNVSNFTSASVAHDDWQDNTYILWVPAGDVLHPRALYSFAAALNGDPKAQLVYVDEDYFMEGDHRGRPFYKPDWSPDYIEAFNFIGHAACFKATIARSCLIASQSYFDFILRFTELTGEKLHIKEILYHRAASIHNLNIEINAPNVVAIEGRLNRTRRKGVVSVSEGQTECYDVKIELAERPLVSIIMSFIDHQERIASEQDMLGVLKSTMNSIASRTEYKNLRFVCLLRESRETQEYQSEKEHNCQVISCGREIDTFAAALNLGACHADGDFLVFLSRELNPVAGDWIERLLEHFEKPHVGAAGAHLLLPGGNTVESGVTLIDGKPIVIQSSPHRDGQSYFYSSIVARNSIAGSSACLMTRSEVFRRVGGFTEALRSQLSSDLDYCLKLRTLGYFTVCAPMALLEYRKPRSESAEPTKREVDYLSQKWGFKVASDPFYNVDHLSKSPPTFELALHHVEI